MGFIRNAISTIGSAADKFVPWAGDIQRAEAHGAAAARLRGIDPHQVDEQYWPGADAAPCTNPEHLHNGRVSEPGRTMTDITNDHNEGRITRPEYDRQYDARLAELGANAFWDEITGAPALALADHEINRTEADREAAEQDAIEDEAQPGGPLWGAENGRPYDQATQDRMINEARYPEREQVEESGESWLSYQEMGQDERLEYLGDRAAEMESGSTEVHDRMAGDGVPEGDRAQAAATAMSWATAAAEVEADAVALDPENADQAALNAPGPYCAKERFVDPDYGPVATYAETQAALSGADPSTYVPEPDISDMAWGLDSEPPPAGPVLYELTELGAAQAVADQMTEREVGPGYLEHCDAELEAGR
jgi:hypothetical protein